MKARPVALLVFAHAACDLNQGAIPALLPFFIAQHHISYAAAATIVFAANLVSTAMQPVYGYIADRRSVPWLIPVALLCAGLGVSLTGVVPNFHTGVIVVGLSGLGVAAFHPEGARLINYLAGERKATAMSVFAVGGQLGYAIGPLMATGALLLWGLKGSLCLFVVPAIVAGVLIVILPGITAGYEHKGSGQRRHTASGGRDAWVPFVCLAAALLFRSIIFYGLNTFIPLFWIDVLHQSKAAGGTALTVLMVSSIGGNLVGGRLADRFGYRTVAIAGFAVLVIVLPLFALAESPTQAMLLLVPVGLAFSAPTGPMVVLGQGYLPNRVGVASGVTLGLAFSFGGIIMPLLGSVADHHGLHAAIWVVALLPILCTALTLTLPKIESATLRAR
ncbi:MAG TPA: MFS transporter [Syntrophorhabdales bacterium]|nr:MFS transporter [Syntrophorhabdales bacterium]